MNTVTTLFFATLRDRIGVRSVELQIPQQTTVANLKNILTEKYPILGEHMRHILVSVNHEYVFEEFIIPDRAEIALFPPVSGG